jgi:hypothetical protein
MSRTTKATSSGQVLSGVGWTLALLAAIYLGFAVALGSQAPGHWGDVVKIGAVCAAAGFGAFWLIRMGRSRKRTPSSTR